MDIRYFCIVVAVVVALALGDVATTPSRRVDLQTDSPCVGVVIAAEVIVFIAIIFIVIKRRRGGHFLWADQDHCVPLPLDLEANCKRPDELRDAAGLILDRPPSNMTDPKVAEKPRAGTSDGGVAAGPTTVQAREGASLNEARTDVEEAAEERAELREQFQKEQRKQRDAAKNAKQDAEEANLDQARADMEEEAAEGPATMWGQLQNKQRTNREAEKNTKQDAEVATLDQARTDMEEEVSVGPAALWKQLQNEQRKSRDAEKSTKEDAEEATLDQARAGMEEEVAKGPAELWEQFQNEQRKQRKAENNTKQRTEQATLDKARADMEEGEIAEEPTELLDAEGPSLDETLVDMEEKAVEEPSGLWQQLQREQRRKREVMESTPLDAEEATLAKERNGIEVEVTTEPTELRDAAGPSLDHAPVDIEKEVTKEPTGLWQQLQREQRTKREAVESTALDAEDMGVKVSAEPRELLDTEGLSLDKAIVDSDGEATEEPTGLLQQRKREQRRRREVGENTPQEAERATLDNARTDMGKEEAAEEPTGLRQQLQGLHGTSREVGESAAQMAEQDGTDGLDQEDGETADEPTLDKAQADVEGAAEEQREAGEITAQSTEQSTLDNACIAMEDEKTPEEPELRDELGAEESMRDADRPTTAHAAMEEAAEEPEEAQVDS